MIKKHFFNKLLVIFVGIIFTLPCITISNSYAQEKTATVGADKIKSILLRPDGWIGEWDCKGGWNELTDLVFEDRGKKIVVKINIPAMDCNCKRKVKITSDGFKMAGCYKGNVHLIFDPDDHMYPFKGDNQTCIFKLKEK